MAIGGDVGAGTVMRLWRWTGILRACLIAGTIGGLLAGGVGGRIAMRIVALVDASTKGVETDSGTVGEITIGGTFSLLMVTTIGGALASAGYAVGRRWLPWTGVPRAFAFGLFILGPAGIIFNEDNPDLQIFEPILPILAIFLALIVAYGVIVALLTDRLHREPEKRRGGRVDPAVRVLFCLYAVGLLAISVNGMRSIRNNEGTCVSADQNGGCAIRATD